MKLATSQNMAIHTKSGYRVMTGSSVGIREDHETKDCPWLTEYSLVVYDEETTETQTASTTHYARTFQEAVGYLAEYTGQNMWQKAREYVQSLFPGKELLGSEIFNANQD